MASIDHLMFQQCLYHRMRYKDVPNVEFMDLKEIALSRKSVEEMRKLIGSKDMNESGRYAAAVKLTELRMQYHLLLKRAARPLSDTNWKNVSLLGPVESKACDGEAKAEAVMNVPNATVEARTPSVEPIPREPVSTKSSSVPRGESRPVRAGSVKALVTQYEAGDVTRDVEVPRRVEEKKEKSVKPRASSVAAIVSSFEPTELDLSPEFEFYTQKLLFNHALATRCIYPSVFSDSSTCSTKLGCPLHAKCAIVGTAHTKLTTTVPPMLSKSTTHPKPCSGNKLEVSALETSKPTRNAMEPSSSCEKPSAHDQNLLVVEINKIQDSESDERSRIRTTEEEELREFATGMAQERKHVEEVYWKKRRRDGKMLQRQEEDVRSSLLLEETQAFNAFKRSHAQFRAECIKRKQECDRASEEQEARRQAALREAEKQARQLEEENRKHAEKERFDEIRRQRRERFLQWVQEENKDPSRDRKTVLPQEPERTARKPTSTKKGMVRQKAQEVVPKCVASPTVGVSVSSSFTQGDLHVQRKRLGECIERRFQLNEQRRVEREAQEKEESERIRKEQEMARERRAVERRERRQNQKRATQIDPASTPELVPSNQPTHKSKSSTGGVSVSTLPSQQKRNGGKHTKSRMRVHESEQQRDLAVKLGLALGCGTTLLAAATLSWTLFFR